MNRLVALIQREFFENRGAIRTTPIVIGALYIIGALMTIWTTVHFDNDLYSFKEGVRMLAEVPEETRAAIIYGSNLLGGSLLFTFVMGVVIFFYLLGALYDDRKDRLHFVLEVSARLRHHHAAVKAAHGHGPHSAGVLGGLCADANHHSADRLGHGHVRR